MPIGVMDRIPNPWFDWLIAAWEYQQKKQVSSPTLAPLLAQLPRCPWKSLTTNLTAYLLYILFCQQLTQISIQPHSIQPCGSTIEDLNQLQYTRLLHIKHAWNT
jgi:hypothetical protein